MVVACQEERLDGKTDLWIYLRIERMIEILKVPSCMVILFLASCSSRPVLSCFGFLVIIFCLVHRCCPVLVVLFCQHYFGRSWCGYPVLAAPNWLSRPSCCFPVILSLLSRHQFPSINTSESTDSLKKRIPRIITRDVINTANSKHRGIFGTPKSDLAVYFTLLIQTNPNPMKLN
jgi:hypothetical protein